MKVALVIGCGNNVIAPGGAQRRLCRIYNALCKENKNLLCDIIVVTPNKKMNSKMLFDAMDCSAENLNIVIIEKVYSLFYFLFNRRYRLVHVWGESKLPVIHQLIFAIRRQKTLRSALTYPTAYNLSSKLHMLMFKTTLFFADYVDLLYPAAKEFVSQYTKGKLSITPGTFTDLNIFQPKKKEKTMVYAAARLEDNKDPKLLLRAVNICKDDIRKNGYRVIVLGKGEHEEWMKSYIAENELNDIVEMAGYQKTSEYLPSAEVFFSLQKNENYPSQSLAEAVACGCYSIITDVGDSRRCATEEFAAFVEGTDVEVARAITQYFLISKEEKENKILLARQFALQNYSIEKSKDYYMNLIEEICNK